MKTIGIFAKEPVPGKVKTRLIQEGISSEWAAKLYAAFLEDTLNLAQAVSCDARYVFYQKGASKEFIQSLQKKGFLVQEQKGSDLGQKMAHFFQSMFDQGASSVVLIGSDSPTLPESFVKEAFEALKKYKVVIGPSRDGGYYLIGLSQPQKDLFKEIEWSTDSVLINTLSKLRALNRLSDSYLLPFWHDVDKATDLLLLQHYFKNHPLSSCFSSSSKRQIKSLFEKALKREKEFRKSF